MNTFAHFAQSVIDATDDYGYLTLEQAKCVFIHCFADYDYEVEHNDMPMTLHAATLLQWLGF